MNAPMPPSFVQQADAMLERLITLDLDDNERRALERLKLEKHRLLLDEAKFLQELTAWAGMTEAEVNYRKAREESMAASEHYYRTMDELRDIPAVKVTEIVPAESQSEEAA